MHLFELTRALVDIDSTTGNEKPVADYLFAHLTPLAAVSPTHAELTIVGDHAGPAADDAEREAAAAAAAGAQRR